MIFKREKYVRKPDENKEYKFSLILQMEFDKLSWVMNVYSRDCYLSSGDDAEKKFEENEKKSVWKLVSKKIPEDMEMIFSQLKDDIFEEINLNFLSSFRTYKLKIS